MTTRPARIDIWHNILWSKYKGEVFSCVYKNNDTDEFDLHFFQVAETEANRLGLSGIDLNHHRYPYTLLFKGAYEHSGFLKRLSRIADYTLHTQADLVVISGYEKPEVWLQLFILLARRKKIAVFCDSTLKDQKQKLWKGLLKSIFFKSVDGIFGYGTRSKEYVIHYGANPNTVYHSCQAAALPRDYTPLSALNMRLKLAPSADVPRFLYVGRLSAEKGLDTLLEAFAKVWAQNTKATLILVGSGILNNTLEQQARTLGISNAVLFAGSKSGEALFEEYAKATAFVLPSTSEPWGLVVNEALSYGCPVIVSDSCGCVPELVITGQTGYVHETGNVPDLAAKLWAATTQFSNIEATAQTCLALIRDYTPDKAADQILLGCREILQKRLFCSFRG